MLAVYVDQFDPDEPLRGLRVAERPEPEPRTGWRTISVRAAALNHHDIWSLRGVGLAAERLPMILGCDAAGVDDGGNEVIVHAVVSSPDWRGDETLDPHRSLLSERHQGTLAQRVSVPARNVVPKPPSLSFEQAACLPTAYLTAYRMLFTRARVLPGQTILVQGAGGGLASALIALGAHAGARVWATSRSEAKRELARALGADAVFATGERLPERVDAVFDSVGAATWSHSLRALKPGGVLVTSGATSGDPTPAGLSRIFFLQLSVVGSTMGTRDELSQLTEFVVQHRIEPLIDRTLPLEEARDGFAAMLTGKLQGKVVFTV
jgi:NADPH:quinone reductase-like Zn-dependent oxidoreductase